MDGSERKQGEQSVNRKGRKNTHPSEIYNSRINERRGNGAHQINEISLQTGYQLIKFLA